MWARGTGKKMKRCLSVILILAVAILATGAELHPDFGIGCNYWASNAGAYMWRRWDGECVESDLDALKGVGIQTLRVFPLWPDFQPITRLSRVMGWHNGYLQADGPFQNEAGVDQVMMERFRFLCDAAEKRGMKLIVGLVTGWMSGRMFAPPAFESVNVITDADAIEWEVRFVRHFVREMKDHPAICAWDLGNECNCMGSKDEKTHVSISRAEAWSWMNQISSAIRLEDNSRPVVSGMHSCPSDMLCPWSLRDQGELMDILTTHPYPLFTPHCCKEPFDSFRNVLHPVAESLYYSGVSGKPCFPEEVGSLGPNTTSEEKTARTLRLGALASRAHGLKGYLWWCAFDQGELDFPPYSLIAVERELGLCGSERTLKSTAVAMRNLSEEIAVLNDLPPRRIDAVCLVSEREDAWPQSFGAFLLSVQAGISISFASAERELPEAKAYILPSATYTRAAWKRICEKVHAGTSLIMTKGRKNAYSELEAVTGCRIESSCDQVRAFSVNVEGSARQVSLSCEADVVVSAIRAKVLIADERGFPFLTVAEYGSGKVAFVNCDLEKMVVGRSDCFREENLNPAYLIYRAAADAVGIIRTGPDRYPFVLRVPYEGEECMYWLNISHQTVNVPFELGPGEGRLCKSHDDGHGRRR